MDTNTQTVSETTEVPNVETSSNDSNFDLDYTGDNPDNSNNQILEPPLGDAQESQNTSVQQPPKDFSEKPQEESSDIYEDIESLRAQLAAANLELIQHKQAESSNFQQPQQIQPPENAFPRTASEVSNLDFLGQDDHISILESREKFNGILNKVATVAYNAAVMAAQERILRQIPSVVETAANQQLQIKDIVGRFYEKNKDLEAYRPAVSMAAINLHNHNPNMPLEELLSKAADETRKVLRIRPGTPTRQRVPAQPVGSGRVGNDRTYRPTNLSEQEQQILDILS